MIKVFQFLLPIAIIAKFFSYRFIPKYSFAHLIKLLCRKWLGAIFRYIFCNLYNIDFTILYKG